MEAESTNSASDGTVSDGFEGRLRTCAKCQEYMSKEKQPKFLTCLHSVCTQCCGTLQQESMPEGAIRCPICKQVTPSSGMIDNLFVPLSEGAQRSNAEESSRRAENEERDICTACEESAVTHFCEECSDWLCSECVDAHRRVRITKDHHVHPKDSVSHRNSATESGDRFQMCPVHPCEPLKLFCDTCDQLTCRDCQLTSHKDHKYEFLDEAARNYRHFLQELLKKVQEKQSYVNNAKILIEKRSHDISKKEERVIQDIKQFAMKLITEINRGAKALLCNLQSISKAKISQLNEKSSAIVTLSEQLDYVSQFSEFMLSKGDVNSLLFSKKQVVYQLRKILKLRCEVPNPNHEVDIHFQADSSLLQHIIPRMGSIIVNGLPFNPRRPPPPPLVQPPNTQSPQWRQHMLKAGIKDVMMQNTRQQQKLKMQLPRPIPPPHSHPASHSSTSFQSSSLPQQSSNISSSNYPQQFLKFPPNVNLQKLHGERTKINLAQLQQERFKRIMGNMSQMTPHAPIVIQPEGSSPVDMEVPVFPDCSQPTNDGMQTEMNVLNPYADNPPHLSAAQEMCASLNDSLVGSLDLSMDKSISTTPENPVTTTMSNDGAPREETAQAAGASTDDDPPAPNITDDFSELDSSSQMIFPSDASIDYDSLMDPTPPPPAPPAPPTVSKRSGSRSRSQAALDQSDPSEDWCAVCKNGGNLLCCDGCPKVFHLNCYVPILKCFPRDNEDWFCCLCKLDDELRLETLEGGGPSAGSKRKASGNLTPKQQMVCERILLELFSHDSSSAFHEPVSKTIPNYYSVVSHPMDLMTIKRRLADGSFKQIEEFVAHCFLIFYNCSIFNDKDSEIGKAGMIMKAFLQGLVKRFLPFFDQQNIDPAKNFLPSNAKRARKTKDKEDSYPETSGEKEKRSKNGGEKCAENSSENGKHNRSRRIIFDSDSDEEGGSPAI